MFPTPKRTPLRAALLSLVLVLVLAIAPSARASTAGGEDATYRGTSLASGDALYAHEWIESPNGQHHLQMQRTGALRLFARGSTFSGPSDLGRRPRRRRGRLPRHGFRRRP
jgi:hypothetical protein